MQQLLPAAPEALALPIAATAETATEHSRAGGGQAWMLCSLSKVSQGREKMPIAWVCQLYLGQAQHTMVGAIAILCSATRIVLQLSKLACATALSCKIDLQSRAAKYPR